MQAVALETTGKEFWIAVDGTLDRIKANRSADIGQPLASIPSWGEIQKAKEGAYCGIPQPINKVYTAEQIHSYLENSTISRDLILCDRANSQHEFVWTGGYKSGWLNESALSSYFQECVLDAYPEQFSCPVRIKEVPPEAKVIAQKTLQRNYRQAQQTLKVLRDTYGVSLNCKLNADLKTLQRELIRVAAA